MDNLWILGELNEKIDLDPKMEVLCPLLGHMFGGYSLPWALHMVGTSNLGS